MTALHVTLSDLLDIVLHPDIGSFETTHTISQGLLPTVAWSFELVPSMRGRVTRPARDVDCFTPRKLLILLEKMWDSAVLKTPHRKTLVTH